MATIAVFGTLGADGLHVLGLSATETSIGYAVVLTARFVLWHSARTH